MYLLKKVQTHNNPLPVRNTRGFSISMELEQAREGEKLNFILVFYEYEIVTSNLSLRYLYRLIDLDLGASKK